MIGSKNDGCGQIQVHLLSITDFLPEITQEWDMNGKVLLWTQILAIGKHQMSKVINFPKSIQYSRRNSRLRTNQKHFICQKRAKTIAKLGDFNTGKYYRMILTLYQCLNFFSRMYIFDLYNKHELLNNVCFSILLNFRRYFQRSFEIG